MANHVAKRRVAGGPRGGQPRRPHPSRCLDPRNDLFPTDPFAVLRSGKALVRAAAEALPRATRQRLAHAFTDLVVAEYWRAIQSQYLKPFPLPGRFSARGRGRLTPELVGLARSLGAAAARLTPVSAAYFIGTTYASILPKKLRAQRGIYYTPPSLAARLLDQAAAAGTDWATASVLDPACGGGAFLAPVAERIAKQLSHLEPSELLGEVERRLRGWEIDPYAAWLAQTTLEAAVLPLCHAAGRRLDVLVDVVNSLRVSSGHGHYDLVIGNPPYGKVTLPPRDRRKFGRSLYGHANLYGLFTDVALRVLAGHGVVAFVTPTSFLAGQYFKGLRGLLGGQAPPLTLDFITERQGVFDDVLQEALLATYRRDSQPVPVAVSFITAVDEVSLAVSSGGWFKLPSNAEDPWLIPRSPEMGPLVERMQRVTGRLRDWGYSVSTGPLVWNRHKGQFSTKPGKGGVPVVWAEAVTANGEFIFRADRRGHRPYFRPKRDGDEWLFVKDSCVLLQRTTAKEQRRRLVAAVLPESFLQKHRGAIVENHLNMIRPIVAEPPVAMTTVAAFLNSRIADLVFRCLSGSVAVSAYELEALPLPAASAMRALEHVPDEAGAMERVWESLYEPGVPEET